MKAWKVTMPDRDPFTFITGQCHTIEEVKAAMLEKFCRPCIAVSPL